MSFAATAWAFGQHRLTPEQKLVLIVLADFHTPEGRCRVSNGELAFETGISEDRLGEILIELKRLHLVAQLAGGEFVLAFDGRGAQ